MKDVSFRYGLKEKLNSLSILEGSINVTTDSEELFVDLNNKRIPLNKPVQTVLVSQEKLTDMNNIKCWFKISTGPKLIIDEDTPINGGSISNGILTTDKGNSNISIPIENENSSKPSKDELELICPEGVTGSISEDGKINVVLPVTRYDEEYTVIVKNKTTGSELEIVMKYTAADMPNFSVDPITMIRTNQGTTQIVNADGSRVYGEDFTATLKSPSIKSRMRSKIRALSLGDSNIVYDDGDNVISIDSLGQIDVSMGLLGGDVQQSAEIVVTRKDGQIADVPITYEPKPGISSDNTNIEVDGNTGTVTGGEAGSGGPAMGAGDITINININNSDNSNVDMSEIEITGLPDGVTATKGEDGKISLIIPPWEEDKTFTIAVTNGYKSQDIEINYTAPEKASLVVPDVTLDHTNSAAYSVKTSDGSIVKSEDFTISGRPDGISFQAVNVKPFVRLAITIPSEYTGPNSFTLTYLSDKFKSTTNLVTYIPPTEITTSNTTLTLNQVYSGTINIRNVDGTTVNMSNITIDELPSGVTATKGTNGNITITVPQSYTNNQNFNFTVTNGVNVLTFTCNYTAPAQPGEKQPDLTLSQGRLWMDRAYAGNKLFLAGGTTNGSTKVNTVDVIDSSLTRTTGTALTQKADQVCGTWNANYAIFAGGFLGQAGSWGSSDAVNAYNSSGVKSTPTSLSAATSSLMGARCGKTGQYALLTCTKNGYLYNNSLTQSTTAVSNADGGQNGGYGATVDNYAIVGKHGSGMMCSYNSSGTKGTVSDLTGSNFPCAAENDTCACFISGNNINIYNSSLVKSTATFGTSAVQGHAIAGKGDNFIVSGGTNSGGSATYNTVHLIKNTGTATMLDSLSVDRWNHQGGTIGDYAIFAGGCQGTGTVSGLSSCEVYTI